ncbi:MAG: PilZ domain-containing protein [Methylocystis sp.]
MSTQTQLKLKTAELDRYPSVKVELHGRFMLPSRAEHECDVIEMSTREIRISAPVGAEIGEKIVIYIAELGRFEGGVTRREPAGFAIGMSLPKIKHNKLAEQLTWYGNREAWDLPDNRRYERIVPFTRRASLQLADGKEVIVKINDISVGGVSIETNFKPPRGAKVTLGARTATVLRTFEGGFVAVFDTPFAEGELNELTRL